MTDVQEVVLVHLGEVFEDAVSGLNLGDRSEKDVNSGESIFTPPKPMAEDRGMPATVHDFWALLRC